MCPFESIFPYVVVETKYCFGYLIASLHCSIYCGLEQVTAFKAGQLSRLAVYSAAASEFFYSAVKKVCAPVFTPRQQYSQSSELGDCSMFKFLQNCLLLSSCIRFK